MATLPSLGFQEPPIRRLLVSGYRAVPPSEALTLDMGMLTLFIGDIESGKSIAINALKLFSLYLRSRGEMVVFNPKKDLFAGQAIPAYIVVKFNPFTLASMFTLQNVSKVYSVHEAVNIIQRIEQLRPKVAATFDTVSLELTPEGKIEFVPFIDALSIGARTRGGLRRTVSESLPELLNLAPAIRDILSQFAEKIDYMPTLFKQLSTTFRGIPIPDPYNPTTYYFHAFMFEYPSDEEFRLRLRDYLSKVLPYDAVRITVERSENEYTLEIQLHDKLRGEWRPLDATGIATSFTLPHITSLARAHPGDIVLLDSVGIALSPASSKRMGRILVEAAARGVQVIASTSNEDVALGVIESATKLPPGQVVVYVVRRVGEGHIRVYRIRPRLPIREPPEAVKALEEAELTKLLG